MVGWLLAVAGVAYGTGERARNVILFLGDAGGIPTLNAAGLYAHNRPQSLFIQSMPHMALMDTSSLNAWVTDSAAGMTAIVTGQKTNNMMLSQSPGPQGQPLKTILEYAEEKGLSTGVVTNMTAWDATPGACYAHLASRKQMLDIFSQLFSPRYGDGVDVLIGAGRTKLYETAKEAGWDIEAKIKQGGYASFDTPAAIKTDANRVISVYDGDDFAPQPVIDTVLQVLSRNTQGYFLMVEWDMHTNHLREGLDRAIVMDELIRHVAGKASSDTLIIYAADHSFDLRMVGGRKNKSIEEQVFPAHVSPSAKPVLTVTNSHTGEEILSTAMGPGAEALHGFIPNTKIFDIMMAAYGWTSSP